MNKTRRLSGYLGAITLVALASLVCESVRTLLAPTNMVMFYLLAVVVAASRLGLKPAILTAFLSVLAFDYLFTTPHFSLRVSDTEYLVTFFALFVVGLVISSLVAKIREKVEMVEQQEARTSSLYHLTRDLTAAVDVPAILEALRVAVLRNTGSRMTVILNRDGSLETLPNESSLTLDSETKEIAHQVLQSNRRAGVGSASFPESPYMFLPVKAGADVAGIMVIEQSGTSLIENLHLLEAFAGQAAMALERVRLSHQAEEARILREKNHLEQALLNSISHDLRTPLVTISGVLDTLSHDGTASDKQRTMISTASEEAARLNRFVGSLLDMTRLEAGALSPRLTLCDVEEIIGCAIGAVKPRIGNHPIETRVETGLPPIPVDLALVTQALVNILDNALKYSSPSEEIVISAQLVESFVMIAVRDSGPGVPCGEEERIFEKFHRLEVPERSGGTGLGLSIAKGIIEAHKGRISAANRIEGGLIVEVILPAAPQIKPEDGC